MPKRQALVPRHLAIHRQSISHATRFRRLPVWVSKADIVAYLKLSPTDAQTLFDNASRRCLIDGVEKISKYQLQTPPYPDLIRVMQPHPSRPSIRRVFRAAIEKILADPSHPQHNAFKKELSIRGHAEHPAHAQRRVAGMPEAAAYLGGSERWLRGLLERRIVPRMPANILGN